MGSPRKQHMYLVHRFKNGSVCEMYWVFVPTPASEHYRDRVREPFGRVECGVSRLPVEVIKQEGRALTLQHPLEPELGVETVTASKVYFHFRLTEGLENGWAAVRIVSSYKPDLPGFVPVQVATYLLDHEDWEGKLLLEKDVDMFGHSMDLAMKRIRFKAGTFKGYIHPQDLWREAQTIKSGLCLV